MCGRASTAEDPQTQVLSVKKQEGHMAKAEGGPREDQRMIKKGQVEVIEGLLSLTTLGRKRPEAKVWSVLASGVTLNLSVGKNDNLLLSRKPARMA